MHVLFPFNAVWKYPMKTGWPLDGRWTAIGWPLDGHWAAVGEERRLHIGFGKRNNKSHTPFALEGSCIFTSCNNSMWPQANFNLVTVPPESDSLVTQVDICGAKWPSGPQARTKCAAYRAATIL